MALSLTTAIQNKVARRVASTTYALAPAYVQALIDGEGASALTTLEMQSAWFNMLSAAGNAPDAWEFYYVSEISLRCALNMFPSERWGIYQKQRDSDRQVAFEHFARLSVTYSPGTTTDAFVYTVQTVRYYVINHCIRLRPALMPAIESIDSALDEVLTTLWNKSKWGFRRRQVTFRVTRTDFTAGVWTEATKIISGLSSLPTLATGQRVYITAATSATGEVKADEYTVSTNAATTITLNNSIISDNTNATAVEGFFYTVEVLGLETSEAFDCFATSFLSGFGTNGTPVEMRWSDGDTFARLRSEDTLREGAPTTFRSVQIGATTQALLFWPLPDQSYDFRGEVLVRQAAAPTAATGTFSKFAAEFLPTIRRMTLANLLTNSGRHNAALTGEIVDEIETRFPAYQEIGPPDAVVPLRDAYGDIEDQSGGTMNVGGQI